MRRLVVLIAAAALMTVSVSLASAYTISFTADQVKASMPALNDASYQWGLWAVRAMPIVGGNGLYTITGGSTTQAGWGVTAPGLFGESPYAAGNHAWFWDESGAEIAGNPANPLYMIMDQPAGTFTSYTFDGSGTWVGSVPPDPVMPPGYDGGAGGTNVVTAVSDTSVFSFDFTLDPDATWNGRWQFVVDGSKYSLGSLASPGGWIGDFFGGYDLGDPPGPGGGIDGNMGAGFEGPPIPEPMSMILGSVGLVTFVGLGKLRRW